MTMLALAKQVEVTVRMITAYEAGAYVPSDKTLDRIANSLRFPVGFFSAKDPPQISHEGASFRSLKAMTAAQRDSAIAAAVLATEFCDWIERRFELPRSDIPSMRGFEAEMAAQALRAQWHIGQKPILNMVHLLEFHGARVFSLPVDSKSVDAFSIWYADAPFIFLNNLKSAERSRFDAAHELAHLTLHHHGGPHGREDELEANKFAAAFLMPRETVMACAPRDPVLSVLIRLKRKWRVALSALLHRLYDLNLITQWRYRSLIIDMAEQGYTTNEPEPIQREGSALLAKVFAFLREDKIPKSAVAKEMELDVSELDSLTRGLVMTAVEGGRETGERPVNRSSANLRLVVD
jgi:Zn-dependent peptidase ImmA (M78 family)